MSIILLTICKPISAIISITLLLAVIVHMASSIGFEFWKNENVPDDKWCYRLPGCDYTTWKHNCQNGLQSPINIPANNLTGFTPPEPHDNISITMYYQVAASLNVYVRTGNFYAQYPDQTNNPIILKWGDETYTFDSIHLHWGNITKLTKNKTDSRNADNGNLNNGNTDNNSTNITYGNSYGSEHTLGNVAYAGELHLAYYNTKKSNMIQAIESGEPTAVLVIAVLIDIHPEKTETSMVGKIINTLRDCSPSESYWTGHNNGQDGTIIIRELFKGEEFAYAYAYNGSLTAPPCSPAQWLVLRRPIIVEELDVAKYLKDLRPNPKWRPNNFRPIQSREDREIRLVKIKYF